MIRSRACCRPDRDPPERVRQKLRAVLAAAVQDPIKQRHAVRFVLPRLANEGDEAAVPFALKALLALPWDAPRAVAYLGRFAERKEVRDGIDGAVRVAATRRDAWLLAQLAPLALRIALSTNTLDALREALVHLTPSPAWGLTLRVLAVNARRHDVEQAIQGPIPDVRAALVALRTLELPIPDALARTEPVLASRLGRETTPLPGHRQSPLTARPSRTGYRRRCARVGASWLRSPRTSQRRRTTTRPSGAWRSDAGPGCRRIPRRRGLTRAT